MQMIMLIINTNANYYNFKSFSSLYFSKTNQKVVLHAVTFPIKN
jgi:hypothetical protein